MEIAKKRDMKIDILRAIAMVCIIVAHSNPNSLIVQLRNFDVVLMIFLLGISFTISSSGKKLDYVDYLKKRFRRLILPTWVFITIFLALFYIIAIARHDTYYFSIRVMLGSYTLQDGIGYVWIMRVFFIIALISPFILKFSEKTKSNAKYLIALLLGCLVYAGLMEIGGHLKGGIEKIYENFVLDGFGYGLVAALGIRFNTLTNKEQLFVGAFALLVFVSFGVYHNFMPTQEFKYPPALYYFSYGIFASILLYKLLEIAALRAFFSNGLVSFLSKHSVWLYFWHIIFVYIIKLYGEELLFISNSFSSRFVFIFSGACIITCAHGYLKQVFTSRKIQFSL